MRIMTEASIRKDLPLSKSIKFSRTKKRHTESPEISHIQLEESTSVLDSTVGTKHEKTHFNRDKSIHNISSERSPVHFPPSQSVCVGSEVFWNCNSKRSQRSGKKSSQRLSLKEKLVDKPLQVVSNCKDLKSRPSQFIQKKKSQDNKLNNMVQLSSDLQFLAALVKQDDIKKSDVKKELEGNSCTPRLKVEFEERENEGQDIHLYVKNVRKASDLTESFKINHVAVNLNVNKLLKIVKIGSQEPENVKECINDTFEEWPSLLSQEIINMEDVVAANKQSISQSESPEIKLRKVPICEMSPVFPTVGLATSTPLQSKQVRRCPIRETFKIEQSSFTVAKKWVEISNTDIKETKDSKMQTVSDKDENNLFSDSEDVYICDVMHSKKDAQSSSTGRDVIVPTESHSSPSLLSKKKKNAGGFQNPLKNSGTSSSPNGITQKEDTGIKTTTPISHQTVTNSENFSGFDDDSFLQTTEVINILDLVESQSQPSQSHRTPQEIESRRLEAKAKLESRKKHCLPIMPPRKCRKLK